MYSRPPGHSFLPIKLVSVVDGAHLRSIRVRLLSNDKVDFLELCNDRLLIKQKHHALQVLDVFDGSVTSVPATVFKSPEVGFPLPLSRPHASTKRVPDRPFVAGVYFSAEFEVTFVPPARNKFSTLHATF